MNKLKNLQVLTSTRFGRLFATRNAGDVVNRVVSKFLDEQLQGSHTDVIKTFSQIESLGLLGGWKTKDVLFGLPALMEDTKRHPPTPPGTKMCIESEDVGKELRLALRLAGLAKAAYAKTPKRWQAYSGLPLSAIEHARWTADSKTLKPAFVCAVDHSLRAIVVSVKGTSSIQDVLVDCLAIPEETEFGFGHMGVIRGARLLCEELRGPLQKLSCRYKDYDIVITGHSLGGAVGAILGVQLKPEFPGLRSILFAPPPCVSFQLCSGIREYTTSYITHHDCIPHASLHNIAKLSKQLSGGAWQNTSWFQQKIEKNFAFRKAFGVVCENDQKALTVTKSEAAGVAPYNGVALTPLYLPGNVRILQRNYALTTTTTAAYDDDVDDNDNGDDDNNNNSNNNNNNNNNNNTTTTNNNKNTTMATMTTTNNNNNNSRSNNACTFSLYSATPEESSEMELTISPSMFTDHTVYAHLTGIYDILGQHNDNVSTQADKKKWIFF